MSIGFVDVFIFLVVAAIGYGIILNRFFLRKGVQCLPPVVFFGNMFKVFFGREHVIDITKRLYDNYPNEKYVGIYNFTTPVILVKDLDLLKKICVKDFDSFVDHMNFTDENIDPMMGRNLFSLDGDRWREMRTTLSPAFTTSKIKAMFPFIIKSMDAFVNHLKQEIKGSANPECHPIESKDLVSRFATDVISSCAFGIETDSLKDRTNDFFEYCKEFTKFTFSDLMKIFVYFFSPRLTKLLNIHLTSNRVSSFFRNLVTDNMTTREKHNIIRPDMIHLLMLAKKGSLHDTDSSEYDDSLRNKPIKTQWSDDELTAQALLFVIAGFDTVSTVLSFSLYELAVNRDSQSKLREEIDDYLKSVHGKIEYQGINKLKYLDMVVSEVLRLWPPVPVADRKCVKAYRLPPINENPQGHSLLPNDGVWIPVYDIQRDPKYFENPNVFDPERFSDERKSFDPYAYMPFLFGPRACIGSRFALMELKIFLTIFISNFDIHPTEKTVYPIPIEPHFFNLKPPGGFWVGLKNRTE